MDPEIKKCRDEIKALIDEFGPFDGSKLNTIGHMDWMIEELIIMERKGMLPTTYELTEDEQKRIRLKMDITVMFLTLKYNMEARKNWLHRNYGAYNLEAFDMAKLEKILHRLEMMTR